MDTTSQILVEPGNPFGFDPNEFTELIDILGEEFSPEYEVRVAYREQVGAAVTLYEVIDFWLSWQSWFGAAQGVMLERLLAKVLEWRRRRHELKPATSVRPIWIRVIVASQDERVVGEVRIGDSDGEPEYGPFSDSDEDPKILRKGPPPVRPWPPKQEDLPQRPRQELTRRRFMLEAIYAMVVEAQSQGQDFVVLDSPSVAGIGRHLQQNAAESKGLFKRLIEEGYLRVRSPLPDEGESGDLHAEVEYLSDRGLEAIGEI